MKPEESEGSVVLVVCVAAAVAALSCMVGTGGAHTEREGPRTATVARQQTARGTRGVVATAAPEATEAALAVLAEGGNAFDATVSASFVLAVVRPNATGLGGGGFAVFHRVATGELGSLDGRETAPASARPDMFLDAQGNPTRDSLDGPKAAGVPGFVALMAQLHAQRGRLPWARLLEPAAGLAEGGFPVSAELARAIGERAEVLARFPASAQLFLPGGRRLVEGDTLVQPDLGRTLRAVQRDGPAGFYRGAVAEDLAAAVREHGGRITPEDLAGYEVRAREPVVGSYRGVRVVSMAPPSSGGVHLIEALNVLSGYDLRALGRLSPDHAHVLTEALRRVFADRAHALGDPDFVEVPVDRLTSTSYAADLRATIDLNRATPSNALLAGSARDGHTSHVSVVDAEGNAVALTHTINTSMGSAFVAGRSGVLLNNEMDDFAVRPGTPNAYGLVQGMRNVLAPRKRPLSSMSPTILLADGRVRAVLGSRGGPRIISAVVQVVSNLVDFGMSLEDAVRAPRLHHQWLPDEVVVERDVPADLVRALAARGHVVRVADRPLGEVQAVHVSAGGERVAASDPRGEGRAGAQ